MVAALAVMMWSAAAQAATYYVAPGGDDGGPGSAAEPWRTITNAARQVSAGDTVIIAGGTYREYVKIVSTSGTDAAPITYRAAAGEHVVIDASGYSNGIEIGESHIVVDGLEIANADQLGIA